MSSAAVALIVASGSAAAVPIAVRAAVRAGFRAQTLVRLDTASGAGADEGAPPPLPAGRALVALAGWVTRHRVGRALVGGVVRLRAGVFGSGRRVRAAGAIAVLDGVARRLRAGQSLPQAVGAIAADAPPKGLELDLAQLASAVEDNGVVAALHRWAAHRSDEPLLRGAAAAIGVALDSGGPALRAIDAAAAALRSREGLAGEVRALTAQARASAAVIGAAPLVMAVLTTLTDPAAARFLFTSLPGLALLTAGLALEALGVVWMVALLRRFRA